MNKSAVSVEGIPFLDLVTHHVEMEDEFVDVFRDAVRGARFIGGRQVEELEKEFAAFTGASHAVGVGSGTDALRFALMAAGVKDGEIVVTVANTFIATTEAVTQAGGTPVFVDVDELTCNMDPKALKAYIEGECGADPETGRPVDRKRKKTVAAVVPVHLYGQTADMDAIMETAGRHNLVVVEDACQAHGAQYYSNREGRWRGAGSMGFAAAFSFYPGKNLGACGEAGAATTNGKEAADAMRMLRDHGQAKKYFHEMEGFNGRLDAIQAGILRLKLRRLEEWNGRRRERARLYNALLGGIDSVIAPFEPQWSRAVYHLYVVRTEKRDALQRHLTENHVGTGLHYPLPLHLQKAYEALGYKKGALPVTEKLASECLSLPMHPELKDVQQEYVAEKIAEFFEKGNA